MTQQTSESVTGKPPAQEREFLHISLLDRLAGIGWGLAWHILFRWSPPPMHWWRRGLLRLFGARIHPSSQISPSVQIDFPWNLRIGEKVSIQHSVIINCMGTIDIGDGTLISQYAHLCAGTHDYEHAGMRIIRCPIKIGRNVWIAADAFVGPDVTLGDECLLAARSSAFHDLPAGQVCIGEPAEPRHDRFEAGKSEGSEDQD